MYPGMDYGDSSHFHHPRVLRTVQDCEATCEHMITLLLGYQDLRSRTRQLGLLRDCADICTLTAKYIARRSPFARAAANLCADICEACGNECLRFRDSHSQACGNICLNCAQECRAFAMGGMA